MGLETENPLLFLDNAKKAVSDFTESSVRLEKCREAETRAGSALENEKKSVSDRLQKTIKARSEDLEAGFNQNLNDTEEKLKKAQSARDKAKTSGVKGRIQEETEELRQENRDLKREIRSELKKDRASSFCDSRLFYILFAPGSFGDVAGFILIFVLCFLALPLGIYALALPKKYHSPVILALLYLIIIILFGGLYIFVNNITKGRHRETIRKTSSLRGRIRSNERKIKAITRGIRTDSDESGYNLGEYDDEIAKLSEERNRILTNKQNAQSTFDTVTKNIITDEIENAARPKLNELEQALNAAAEARAKEEKDYDTYRAQLEQVYVPVIGRDHLNQKDISKIHRMISSGETQSVIDAVSRLENSGK